jgi:hypothetical protein
MQYPEARWRVAAWFRAAGVSMTVAMVAPDGWVRGYSVRAPPDWFVSASEKPLPMCLFLPDNTSVEEFADIVGIDKFLRGAHAHAWPTSWPPETRFGAGEPVFGSDPRAAGGGYGRVGGTVDATTFPKMIAIFVNPMSPRNEVAPGLGPGEHFNSGSVGAESAQLWDSHDVIAIRQIRAARSTWGRPIPTPTRIARSVCTTQWRSAQRRCSARTRDHRSGTAGLEGTWRASAM